MKKYRLRFNLGRGENYRKWQIKNNETKEVLHLDPEMVQLKLHGCILNNKKINSEKIFNGANKNVCSWVELDSYDTIIDRSVVIIGPEIKFNPRKNPYWVNNKGEDIDYLNIKSLITYSNRLFIQ